MADYSSTTTLSAGTIATVAALKNSQEMRSLSDATWAQMLDGSFSWYISDVLAIIGILGLIINIVLAVRRDRRNKR